MINQHTILAAVDYGINITVKEALPFLEKAVQEGLVERVMILQLTEKGKDVLIALEKEIEVGL